MCCYLSARKDKALALETLKRFNLPRMNKHILMGLGTFGRTVAMVCVLAVVFLSTVFAKNNPTYFPKDVVSDSRQEWFSKHLSAMKEPVLTVRKDDKDYFAFRYLYLSEGARPMAMRIEKADGKIVLRIVVLSGDGGFEPGRIKHQKQSELTEEEFDAFMVKLEKSGLWNLPYDDRVGGFGGSRIVIETIKDGKHFVFTRWTPQLDTKERKLSGVVRFQSQLFEMIPSEMIQSVFARKRR